MKNTTFVLLFLSGIIFYSSCTKQRAPVKTPGPNYVAASSFYSANKQPVQTFTVDSPGTGPIIGKMGTVLSGNSSVFMIPGNPSQNVGYPFTLQLIENYPIKDFILSQLPSVGAGKILQSQAEISIQAYKLVGGVNTLLVLRPGKKYPMRLDSNITFNSGNSVYYGFPNTVSSRNITDWTSNVTSLNSAISHDTLSKVYLFSNFCEMFIARMGYVSCAQSYAYPNAGTTITFTPPSNSTNGQNIDIYLVFKGIHSMMQVYNLTSQAVPTGTTLTYVAISTDSNSGNSLVYDSQTITVTAGQTITLNPVSISSAALLADLAVFQ
jgi:hypothetical protein